MPTLDERIGLLPAMTDPEVKACYTEIFRELYPLLAARSRRGVGQMLRQTHAEDAAQVAAERVLQILGEYRAGKGHQAVHNWTGYLLRAASYAVSQWLGSAEVTALSGVVSKSRRIRRIPGTVERLYQELRRVPTADEVAAAHNAEMRRRQKNPGRHGSLISREEAAAFI